MSTSAKREAFGATKLPGAAPMWALSALWLGFKLVESLCLPASVPILWMTFGSLIS